MNSGEAGLQPRVHTSDYLTPVAGWRLAPNTYGPRGAVGHASEQAAKIWIAKHRKDLNTPAIIPFQYWDGSVFSNVSTRYVVLVKEDNQ